MADKTIKIRGEFDANGILASFKKIRDEAAKGGIGDKMLVGYDKELEKAEKLTTQMLALLSKGLNNAADIKEFTRTVNQLEKTYGILNVKATSFADANNYAKQNAEIKKYASLLDLLVKKLDELRKIATSLITAKANKLKLDKEETNLLKKALGNAEAYKKIVDDITVAKAKALLLDINKAAIGSDAGLKALSTTGTGNFEFGVAAKKGRDANRANLVKKGVIDVAAALTAAQKEYLQVLLKTMEKTGSAEDTLKAFTEVMRKYKLEVTNADEVLELFALDMEKIANAGLNTPGGKSGKGGIDPNKKGEFTRRRDAINNISDNFINNTDVLTYLSGELRRIELTNLQAEAERKYGDQLKTITDNINKERTVAEQAGNSEINKRKLIIAEALKYVSVQQSIENGFNRIGQGAKQVLSVTTSWRALRNVVKSTFNDIKDLDKAFGSIAMVTSYSVKDMWAQYDQYAAMANKLGQSTKSVVEASALYYQQGLKTNEVMLLTEETMKLATLAGLDFKDATSQMTAALRAFHMDMSEGAHVTDVYAEVAAHAAVDVQGLSEAMSATAAIANSAGMSFENTTAMLATMVEATQEAPKNLGTAMKTILARFTELKNNVAGTADSEFDDLDYNKVDKALKSVGVSLKDTTGLFRNMDDVLLELSGKWKGLDRNSLRYIATIAAGSRQQSRFIALMENYERTMQLVDVALNSAGRSSQQFAKYLDTVEYRMKLISNTWELFKTNLLTSDFYKDTLDNFKGFLEKLNDLSTGGLVALGATWLTLGRKAISGTLTMGSNFISSKFTPKSKADFATEYKNDNENASEEDIDRAYEDAKAKGVLKGQAIGTAISTSIATGITSGLAANTTSGAVIASISTSLIPNIMAGILMGGPHGAILAVGATLGSAFIAGVTNFIKANAAKELNKTIELQVKNAQKALDESTSKLELKLSEARDTQNTIKDLENIKKLYDELKNKIVLTEDELKKYSDLVSNLKENYPSLIAAYDEETGKIKLNNLLLELRKKTLTELEKQLSAAALQELFYNNTLANRKSELDIKNKYYSDLKNSLSLSSSDLKNLSIDIANVNSSNIEDFKKSVEDLAKKNEASGETLLLIHTTLEDFEASYVSNLHNEDRDTYETVLAELRKNNESLEKNKQLTDSLLRIRAERILKKQINEDDYKKSEEDDYKTSAVYDAEYGYKYAHLEKDDTYSHRLILFLGGMTNWENLTKSTKRHLEEAGISEKDYKNYEDDDDIEGFKNFVAEKFEALYKSNVYKKLANEDLTEEEKKSNAALETYLKRYSKDNIEEFKNKIEELKKLDVTDFTLNATFPVEEVKLYEELLKKLYLTNSKTFKNLPIEVIESQGQIFLGLIDKFGESGELGKTYEKFVQTIKGFGLTSELQNILLRFNPVDLDGMTKNEARDTLMLLFLSAIDDGKIGKEAAKETVNNYLNELEKSNLGDFSVLSTSALTKIESEIKEKYNKIITNYKTAIDTINSNITNGFIDYLDKDKIEDAIKELKLDPADYIYTDEKGNYLVNVEALNEDVKKQATNESEITKEIEAQIKNGIEQLTQKEALVLSIINLCQGELENYKILKLLTKEYGKLYALRNRKELEDVSALYDIDWKDDGSALINSGTLKDLNDGLKQIQTQRAELQKSLKDKDYIQSLANMAKGAENKIDQVYKTYTDTLKDFGKERDKAYKDWQDKTKAVADAQKSLAKAIETVAEKQKELKATIEGTNWKSSIDGMYNYNTALDFLTKQTERAKKDLEKASTIDAAKRNFAVYGQGLLDQKALLQAQNLIYRTAYNNIGKVYNNDVAKLIKSFEDSGLMKFNLADYLAFDEKTGTKINMNALQKAKMPEALKKWIETLGQKANEYLTKIWDNDDKVKLLNEEFIEHLRQALDGYVELQDKMIEVLREKYQKQVDDLRTKYEAMNEADDLYVDALLKNIDKQRKLRDLEKSWNELENKERKLALLRRDTSRGNAVEVKSLEKEVQDDRTSLLDSAVDDIIEKLREFYELQKELRELEITYQEALIDDVALMKEATEALLKILTSDELVNWWKKNVTEMEKMSDEKLQKEKLDWAELFKKKTDYVTSVDDTVLASIQNSEKNLKDVADKTEEIVRTTSEGITELASKSLEEAGEEYKKAVKTAKDALLDAVDAVAKLKEALLAAIEAANESKKAFDDIAAKYKEALSKNTLTGYVITYSNGKTTTVSTLAEVNRSVESLPPELRNKNYVSAQQTTVLSKDVAKNNITPYSNTSNMIQKQKNLIIGQRGDIKKVFNSEEELKAYNAANYRNAYSLSNEKATILDKVLHGVLTYNEKDKKWELYRDFTKEGKDAAIDSLNFIKKTHKEALAFAEGGLVNFTGPAWVDGSRSRPEAFLSAEDTRRIGEAARILADLPILSQPVNQEQLPTTTIGDTTIQIDVHVDSIASDYDFDEAMDKVEKRIVEAAKYTGSNVILKKR